MTKIFSLIKRLKSILLELILYVLIVLLLRYGFLSSRSIRREYSYESAAAYSVVSCEKTKWNPQSRRLNTCVPYTSSMRPQIRGYWLLKTTRLLGIWLVFRPEAALTDYGCDIALSKRQDTLVLVPFWVRITRTSRQRRITRKEKSFDIDELLIFDRISLRFRVFYTKKTSLISSNPR